MWFSSPQTCSSNANKANNQVQKKSFLFVFLFIFFSYCFFFLTVFFFHKKKVSLEISIEGSLVDASSSGSESYGVIFDDDTLSKSTINGFNISVNLVRRERKRRRKRRREKRTDRRARLVKDSPNFLFYFISLECPSCPKSCFLSHQKRFLSTLSFFSLFSFSPFF